MPGGAGLRKRRWERGIEEPSGVGGEAGRAVGGPTAVLEAAAPELSPEGHQAVRQVPVRPAGSRKPRGETHALGRGQSPLL